MNRLRGLLIVLGIYLVFLGATFLHNSTWGCLWNISTDQRQLIINLLYVLIALCLVVWFIVGFRMNKVIKSKYPSIPTTRWGLALLMFKNSSFSAAQADMERVKVDPDMQGIQRFNRIMLVLVIILGIGLAVFEGDPHVPFYPCS